MDVDKPTSSAAANPLAFLEQQEAAAPSSLQPAWTQIRTTYEKKLWHNLTVALLEFVALPGSGTSQIELFDNPSKLGIRFKPGYSALYPSLSDTRFITTVETKINALKLVEIARRVGREYSEPDLTLKFLESVHSRLKSPYPVEATEDAPAQPKPARPVPEAYALSLSALAYAQLLLGDLEGCKKRIDECEKLLGEQDTVEPVVNAGYYGVAADYYKVKADYGPYYKNALLYLACVDDRELSDEDRKARAHDLCIAALLGENIYNFGELLQHPILQTLEGTSYGWIKDLISSFNAGAIGKFDSLSNNFDSEPILKESSAFLRQKICLMALIQAAFERPRDGKTRLMTFEAIGEATRLPVHEVEHLIMKALSLGLIRGSLDQVASTVDLTWVQPRVLEGSQLDTLAEQFGHWTDAVGETANGVAGLENGVRLNGVVAGLAA